MAVVLLSYIWLWQGAFPGHFVVCVALYFAIGVSTHLRRGETAREIGFRLDNLAPAGRQALLFVGPLVVVPPVVGLIPGSLRVPRPAWWLPALVAAVVWGTAQQYGLLCVFYRRFQEIVPGAWPPMIAAAAMFALFHLPNPFLTAVTFGAGVLSCWLYRRVPNVWVLGVAHGVLSLSISRSLPLDVTVGMRVGPGFLHYLAVLRAGGVGS